MKNGIACHSDNCAEASTLEGRVVRISDKVAYINHDIEDAIRGGILNENDLPYDCIYVLGRTKSERITTIIKSIIENSKEDITMDSSVLEAHNRLKSFMFDAVYTNPVAKGEEKKAEKIVKILYEYYLNNINLLPPFYGSIIERYGKERAVCDYIAGMSDKYAIDTYKELFIPKSWSK